MNLLDTDYDPHPNPPKTGACECTFCPNAIPHNLGDDVTKFLIYVMHLKERNALKVRRNHNNLYVVLYRKITNILHHIPFIVVIVTVIPWPSLQINTKTANVHFENIELPVQNTER